MYRIIKVDGTELGLTDSVNYIRILDNGAFTITTEENAIGVAFDSVPYNLIGHDEIEGAETVIVCKVDTGKIIEETASYAELATAIREGVNEV